MLEIAHACAAVIFFHGDAEDAEVAHLAPQIVGEIVLPVDVGGAWRDLVAGEAHDRIAKHVGGVAECEVETGKTVRDHGRVSNGGPTLGRCRARGS
jgi:hypothetical protein